MSYQQKRSVVSIISGLLVLGAYCFYAFEKYQSSGILNDMKSWASTMLLFIGIGIVVMIIIQIVFHILLSVSIAIKEKIQNEQSDDKAIEKSIELEMVEDEMDKLIELKSNRVGFAIAGIGFITGLVSLILDYSPVVMMNIMFISFIFGSLIEECTKLYFYRSGVKNG